jgi:hypothetical protein
MNIGRLRPRIYLTIRTRYAPTVTAVAVLGVFPCIDVSCLTVPGAFTPSPDLPAGKWSYTLTYLVGSLKLDFPRKNLFSQVAPTSLGSGRPCSTF